MSKQCTNCGSYNTERSMRGTANYFLRQTARFAVAGGTSLVVGTFNKSAGQGAGRAMLHNTENWVSTIKLYYCCDCGKDFNPID